MSYSAYKYALCINGICCARGTYSVLGPCSSLPGLNHNNCLEALVVRVLCQHRKKTVDSDLADYMPELPHFVAADGEKGIALAGNDL